MGVSPTHIGSTTDLVLGVCAAFSGVSGKVRYNFGEAPFQHAPPAADYQAFVAFEAQPLDAVLRFLSLLTVLHFARSRTLTASHDVRTCYRYIVHCSIKKPGAQFPKLV